MLSSSAIKLAKQCFRRAVGQYVGGFRGPSSPKADAGKRLHTEVQDYLAYGTALTSAATQKLVSAAWLKPASVAPHNIERVLTIPEHHGYIDFEHNGIVHDLKFTSNVRYQVETDPKEDDQRLIYALDWFARYGKTGQVELRWLVGQFDGSRAIVLETNWEHAQACELYERHTAPTARRLHLAIAQKARWQDAEPNYSACNAYGVACPMIAQGCTPKSIMERLCNAKGGKPA